MTRLTSREAEVLEALARTGASNRQIAIRLFMSEQTVKAHMGNIFRKLRVRTRTEAVIVVWSTGVVEIDSTADGTGRLEGRTLERIGA
jgi:DNA-binding NarL/FixJ family response regulator